MPLVRAGIVLVFAGLLLSCRVFEHSPYQVSLEGRERGLTRSNLAKLAERGPRAGDSFSLAALGDTHTDYDDLRAAIRHINADTTIQLAVITGDLTHYGLLKEYRWLSEALARLAVPWFTVLGNHDAQANGVAIYRDMFGPLDYSFTFRGTKFVLFNDNAWEFACCAPDLPWLQAEFSDPGEASQLFAVSHMPPYADQFDSAASRRLRDLLEKHAVRLSLHGHQHNYRWGTLEGGKVPYLVADKLSRRNYAKITVAGRAVTVERVYF